MITEETPADWHALQSDVAKILEECGFDVAIERTIPTVRGDTEVDVYAEEIHRGRKTIVLCECKHWKARIPKTVVHAFRTTVADTGANVGYIIGSSGFQAGAFDAAELTNIKLLTWEQFQEEFLQQWLEIHLAPTLSKRLDRYLSHTEYFHPEPSRQLTADEWLAFRHLWEAEQPLNALVMPLMPWSRLLQSTPRYPKLPLAESAQWRDAGLPKEVLSARGYRELADGIVAHADVAVFKLRAALYLEG